MEQINDSRHRPRRTMHQINDLLTQFETSGLTAIEFCELHQIHKSNFYKWISRAKNKSARLKPTSGFAPVQVTPAHQFVLFAEVKGIRIYQPVAASYLKELLK